MVIKKRGVLNKDSLGKKGSAHLEILISFTLFVGFTLFLLFTLEPTKQDLLEESILFNVQDAFFRNATTNLSYALVNATNSSGHCIVCYPSEMGDGGNKFSKESTEEEGCFRYIYSSDEFSSSGIRECNKDGGENYSVGYIYRLEVLSNRTLQEIKREYYEDYSKSKERFGVPPVVDFSIDFNESSPEYDLDKTIPETAQVIAGSYRKKVLYTDGTLINQDFIIRVW